MKNLNDAILKATELEVKFRQHPIFCFGGTARFSRLPDHIAVERAFVLLYGPLQQATEPLLMPRVVIL